MPADIQLGPSWKICGDVFVISVEGKGGRSNAVLDPHLLSIMGNDTLLVGFGRNIRRWGNTF